MMGVAYRNPDAGEMSFWEQRGTKSREMLLEMFSIECLGWRYLKSPHYNRDELKSISACATLTRMGLQEQKARVRFCSCQLRTGIWDYSGQRHTETGWLNTVTLSFSNFKLFFFFKYKLRNLKYDDLFWYIWKLGFCRSRTSNDVANMLLKQILKVLSEGGDERAT